MNLQITGLKVDTGAGPGSRGGKIIGHTSGGKPIYSSHGHAGHADFTKGEHGEAAEIHTTKSNKALDKNLQAKSLFHFKQSRLHKKSTEE